VEAAGSTSLPKATEAKKSNVHDHSTCSHSSTGTVASASDALKEDEKHPWTAIVLTTISGLAAVFGGLLVIMVGVPSNTSLGHMLSFAAGVMMYISYADLLQHAVIGVGFYWANVWVRSISNTRRLHQRFCVPPR
jgi:zinc transporter ZupT